MKKQLLWLLGTCIILNWYVKSTLDTRVKMQESLQLIAQKKSMLTQSTSIERLAQPKKIQTRRC